MPVPTATIETTTRVRADEPDLLEALLVAAGPHLDPVLDVGTTASGDLLMVRPAPAVRLVELLTAGGLSVAGEAVTVLVPLAEALRRLHAAGVAGIGADAAAVVLDADGSPAWSPRSAVLLRRVGPLAFSTAVDEDLAHFSALSATLLERCGRARPAPARTLEQQVDALFALADPVPVRLEPTAPPAWSPDPVPARLVAAVADEPDAVPTHRWLAPLTGVRRRVWVAAGAVAVLLVIALIALPQGGRNRADAIEPLEVASAPSASIAPVAPRSIAAAAAVRSLLAARAQCLGARRAVAACLDRTDSAGSPVHQADLAAIAGGADAVLPSPSGAHVVSSGGSTAVVDCRGAVVVAVREHDGWRLRDVVAEPPR